MSNVITIINEPVQLPQKYKVRPEADLRLRLAKKDLELASSTIQRRLEHEIPLSFNFEVSLRLSINITTFKIKIDYSRIQDRTSRKLIRLYLNNEREDFAHEWMRLR